MGMTAKIQLPPKLLPVLHPGIKTRYRCAYGGRGSGKSFSFAKALAIRGYATPLRILCSRELQNSIKDSVHHEIVAAIESEPWLSDSYDWGESFVRGRNGTEFIFKGLRHNYRDIKSTSGIDICWVEEAETVSADSWRVLVPTIRKPGSEIWATWNPERLDSSTRQRFILEPPSRIRIAEVNWRDNPWFPDELEEERLDDLRRDPDMYQHIWEGACITRSDAQVFKDKWVSREFTPDPVRWDGPYNGLDFGFSTDPTAAVKCWVHDDRLWIEHEAGKVGLELDDTAKLICDRVPGFADYVVRADSARPESISYLKRHGVPRIEGVEKWKGSVEDGITFLRSFAEIVIHPRCSGVIQEATDYCYKVDRNTGDVLPDVVDKHNHYWDAVRYALAPMIKRKPQGLVLSRHRR